MKKLFILLSAIFYLLSATCLPTVALAQEPTPELPYHFEPVDFDPNAAPSLPLPSVTTPDFINALGSYALTVFALLDKYQVLGIFVVIMLGLGALWWLYSFVADRPVLPTLDLSDLAGTVHDVKDFQWDQEINQFDSEFVRAEVRKAKQADMAKWSKRKEFASKALKPPRFRF